MRNAGAVAGWLTRQGSTTSVAVVAAGERWPDGSMRPSVEDGWGAGAVIDALATTDWEGLSPEAAVARAGYLAVREDVESALLAPASGRELVEQGFGQDVAVAGEVGSSTAVLLLGKHGFTAAPGI